MLKHKRGSRSHPRARVGAWPGLPRGAPTVSPGHPIQSGTFITPKTEVSLEEAEQGIGSQPRAHMSHSLQHGGRAALADRLYGQKSGTRPGRSLIPVDPRRTHCHKATGLTERMTHPYTENAFA